MNKVQKSELKSKLRVIAEKLKGAWVLKTPKYNGSMSLENSENNLRLNVIGSEKNGYFVKCVYFGTIRRKDNNINLDKVSIDDIEKIKIIVSQAEIICGQLKRLHQACCMDFETKLKNLLQEYDVSIEFRCDDESDWYGITGEKIGYVMGTKFIEINPGTEFYANDIL